MTTQTKTPPNGTIDETAEKILKYNEKALETGKKLTGSYIDSYEKAALSLADFQEKVAGASNVEWVTTVVSAQAGLTRELAKAQTSAARELLK
jgi:hypothetical protein